MRVKWNRQLDGSLNRRQSEEDQPPSKDKECKQKGSPKFFRLFRRKKPRRPDDGQPPDEASLYTPAPSEADEDDCASVSSVASQPVTGVCHRDRTLSIFSSFRIGFPGGKKKKRPPLPTSPDDDQLFQPEKDRYSSPDLRKERLDVPQTELSMSSPSVVPSDFASLGELRTENSQSFHHLRHRDGGPKLAKSVSFSDCQAGQPASLARNDTFASTVNGPVEENPKASRRKRLALASEAPRSGGQAKSTADDSGSSSVQVLSYSEATSEMNSRVRNCAVKAPLTAQIDLPGKWVKYDTTTKCISNPQDTNGNVCNQLTSNELSYSPKVNQKCITQSVCIASTDAELLPKISTSENRTVKSSSESSNAKICAVDTYVQSVNLPGTCISISNFVEELAVRNASKDNLFPVSVPDCSVFDSLNLNGSPSSGSVNARSELSTKSNEDQIKLATSPDSSNVEFPAGSGMTAANCVREFAVRSNRKDTMLSVCEMDCPVNFVTEYAVKCCDLKDNIHSVCDLDYFENGVHTLTSNGNLNHQDGKTIECTDHLPQSESLTSKSNVPLIKYSPGDSVLNSKRYLSDPNNEDYINIHQSTHITRDSCNSSNIVPQVNEPDSLFSPSPETICPVNDNELAIGNMKETLDLDKNRQIPVDICISTQFPKEQLLANFLDYLSSENKPVNEKSIEFLKKAIVTNYCECPPNLDCCLNFLKGDQFLNSRYTIPTELAQQNDFMDSIQRRKRSILNLNHPFLLSDSINNNSPPDVESYLQKLIVAEECSPFPHTGWERNLTVWNASFVQNICRYFISHLDLPCKQPDARRVMNDEGEPLADRDVCANDHPPVRGKQLQDRCPDASLPMSTVLPSGPSNVVTLDGPDLHTGGTDTPQYASDVENSRGGRRCHTEGDPGTTPAMLSDMSVGIYDGVFSRETYLETGEILESYPRQMYDICRYTTEGCSSGVASPEISGDSCVSGGSSFIQGEKHSDTETCASESYSPDNSEAANDNYHPVINGYLKDLSGKHSGAETCESLGLSAAESPLQLDITEVTNGDDYRPVINGYLERSSGNYSHNETCGSVELSTSESHSLRLDSTEVINGDDYSPVLNGYLERSSDLHSGTETCESVGFDASELSSSLQDTSEVTNVDTYRPVVNGYLEGSSEKLPDTEICEPERLLVSESYPVQEDSIEVTNADNYRPAINRYREDSSGDESYVESLLLTGELTEELISTTLRTDTGMSGTLDEEEVSSTISLISDRDVTDGLLKNDVMLHESGDLKLPGVVNEDIRSSECNENEIPYEGVKNKIKMFESNSPDVSMVASAPDITVIVSQQKIPQARRKSADKGKSSMIPSLRKRPPNVSNERQPEPVRTKKAATENKRVIIENKTSDARTKRSGKQSQDGLQTVRQISEKRDSFHSETSFDCCIIREVKSDYKCFDNSGIEHVLDSNLRLTTQQISEEATSFKSNPLQSAIKALKSDYKCFDDSSTDSEHVHESNHCSPTQQISEDAISERCKSEEILAPNVSTNTNPSQNAIEKLKSDYNCFDHSGIGHLPDSNLHPTTQQISEEAISERCKSEEILASTAESNPNPRQSATALKPVPTVQVCEKDVFNLSSSLDDFDDQFRAVPCSEGRSSNLTLDEVSSTGVQGQCGLQARCASLPLVVGQVQSTSPSKERTNYSRRNYLIKNKDVATCGRSSRIPRKQGGGRGAHTTSKPVRPPMWLSKAELTQEIQRLGNLCEARTKELNRLKMETKHVSVGFDAFAALFKYMVEDLNALSVPMLSADLQKTLKQLELAKQDLAYYEREVEEMKAHHCQELNDLSNKLFEVFQGEVTELSAKHQEEMNRLNHDHQKQIESLTTSLNTSSAEVIAQHEELVTKLQQELINQREELQLFQEREIMDLEEKHTQSTKTLQEHIEQLQKKCAELKQHSMGMEDAMRKDTDSKLQWVTAWKVDLEKEVESLKTVLEMKNKELHTIRVQNLEMEKQLEELPLAREKIKMLQARAEDLEALMIEKTKLERKLCTENHQILETYEKESKVNRRLSMENEELQWRLRQAEQTLISGSFSDVLEYPEEENGSVSPAKSPSKSPGPHAMSRSVFFTFVDKDHSSPKSQYKKITPGFSSSYKTSPAKSSKSPPAPSPRRGKSHSEPPQPPILSSTPRKVAKQSSSKQKSTPKRQRSGSDCGKPSAEHGDVNFLSVTGSMTSSVSSESSVFEHKERFLEENKEQILHSLEILREQRNAESEEPVTPNGVEDMSPHFDQEDMSRSSEFSDPKTYYHMTFPVLKEAGIPDGDMDDGGKVTSHDDTLAQPTHSKSNSSSFVDGELHSSVVDSRDMNGSALGAMSQVAKSAEEERQHVYVKPSPSNDDVRDADCKEQTEEQNIWRTI